MIDHERAETLLADFADGCLPDELKTELQHHLESCISCTEWLVWYRDIKAAVDVGSGHPSAGDLAMLAVRPQDLSDEDRSRIEDHVKGCPECQDLLTRSRSALEPAPVVTPFRRSIARARWALPLAAALVLGIFGGRVMRTADTQGGVVTYRVIGSAARAAQGPSEVVLSPGIDQVLIAVDVPLIQNLTMEDLVEITLTDDRGSLVWRTEIEVEEVRRRSADGRMLLVAIPVEELHQGRFVIRVGASTGAERVEFPFIVGG